MKKTERRGMKGGGGTSDENPLTRSLSPHRYADSQSLPGLLSRPLSPSHPHTTQKERVREGESYRYIKRQMGEDETDTHTLAHNTTTESG